MISEARSAPTQWGEHVRDECLFCTVQRRLPDDKNPEDTVLTSNSIIYAKPGLGAISEGYTLVVTREHVPCFASLSPTALAEVELFVDVLSSEITARYGRPVAVFEHGVLADDRKSGCCIDHAHLHLAPASRDFDAGAAKISDSHRLASLADLASFREHGCSYLFYRRLDGESYAYLPRQPIPSQFLRMAWARVEEIPETWDWELYPRRDRIKDFLTATASG